MFVPLLVSLLLCPLALGSPFDAHVQPVGSSSPFFEGWFTKTNDFQQNLSFAVIFGSFQPPNWALAADFKFEQHWIAFLYFNLSSGETFTVQDISQDTDFPVTVKKASTGAFITTNPAPDAPVDFIWNSTKYGTYAVRDNVTEMRFQIGDVKVNVTTNGRKPWSEASPNADGPEGILGKVSFLLPCHYAVHSLASPTTYSLQAEDRDVEASGKGWSHMETNYGDIFPTAWTWAQGFSSDGSKAFVLTGGKFKIGILPIQTWVVAYRSETFEWNFRPTELDSVSAEFDGCDGILNLTAVSLTRDKMLTMLVKIPPGTSVSSTFSDHLYFPTVSGFSNDPGCIESYLATAELNAYTKTQDSSLLWPKYELAETVSMEGVALEFGGDFLCQKKTHSDSQAYDSEL
jgi:hypothetical protein